MKYAITTLIATAALAFGANKTDTNQDTTPGYTLNGLFSNINPPPTIAEQMLPPHTYLDRKPSYTRDTIFGISTQSFYPGWTLGTQPFSHINGGWEMVILFK